MKSFSYHFLEMHPWGIPLGHSRDWSNFLKLHFTSNQRNQTSDSWMGNDNTTSVLCLLPKKLHQDNCSDYLGHKNVVATLVALSESILLDTSTCDPTAHRMCRVRFSSWAKETLKWDTIGLAQKESKLNWANNTSISLLSKYFLLKVLVTDFFLVFKVHSLTIVLMLL